MSMSLPLCCFSDDKGAFAIVSNDQRLKIWDTISASLIGEYTEDKHLSIQYTSIAFTRSGPVKKHASSLGLVALGTAGGAIVIWNLSTSEIVHRLVTAAGQSINHVLFNNAGKLLFSCGGDGKMAQWDVKSGALVREDVASSQPVSRLCLSPDNHYLLSAGSSIKLWELASNRVIRRFPGHSSNVHMLAFSADGKFFASAASDRVVSLWASGVGTEATAKSTVAVKAFSVDSPPVYIAMGQTKAKGKAAGGLQLCVLSAKGLGYVWRHPGPVDAPTTRPDCVITAAGSKTPLISACFRDGRTLALVRATAVRPLIEDVSLVNKEGQFVSSISLAAAPAGLLSDKAKPKKASADRHAAAVVDGDACVEPQEEGAEAAPKRPKPQAAMSIEERLAQQRAAAASGSSLVAPAGSLQTVLSQALQSSDAAMIELVLQQGAKSDKLVAQTVQRLPTGSILPLTMTILDKFQAKPSRGMYLIVWVTCIIKTHTSYIMSVPAVASALAQLYTLIDKRLSSFKKLLKLSGRLDLLMCQLNRPAAAQGPDADLGLGDSMVRGPVSSFSEQDADAVVEAAHADVEEPTEDADMQDE